jgi:hypothetical protein
MATEYILKAQGKWTQVLRDYIGERSPKKSSSGLVNSWEPEAESKNPSVVCLGRARVDNRWATVSPYSPCCFQESLLVKTRLPEKVSHPFVNLCKSLNSCNSATYSGIAGGRAAINSVNRASLRRPANSGSLYTLSIPLYPSSRALRRYCSDRSESPRLAQSFAIM